MSHFESTFKGHELLNSLEPVAAIAWEHNCIEQNGKRFFKMLLEQNFRSMDHFLKSGFLFLSCSPSTKFWVDLSKEYSDENELLAFSELTLL